MHVARLPSEEDGPAADQVLEIKLDIGCGARAADKHIAAGGLVDGLWIVKHLAADKRGLAGVTYAGATCPSHWNIARLGEFQQALEFVGPTYVQTASTEGDAWPIPLNTLRWMRTPYRPRSDTRRYRGFASKGLRMDIYARYANALQASDEAGHEARRPAYIELRRSWRAESLDCRGADTF